MILLKNNELDTSNLKQLSKTHNDKKETDKKTRLYISKAQNFVKSYHPLKQKKIKLHRLKFVSATTNITKTPKNINILEEKNDNNVNIFSKKYMAIPGGVENGY